MLDDVNDPVVTGPHDIAVRIGGAWLCPTDLQIRTHGRALLVP